MTIDVSALDSVYRDFLEFDHEFDNFLGEQKVVLGFESIDLIESVSLEEERESHAKTGIHNPATVIAQGLTNKANNGIKSAANATAKGALDAVAATPALLAKITVAFMERLSGFVNKMSTMISKLLLTLYPTMGKIIEQAEELKEKAEKYERVKKARITVKGSSKFLALENGIASESELLKQLSLIDDIQEILLDKDKLRAFQTFSDNIFEPYRDTISKNKVDPLVFSMAILGTLTNPGVPVGAVLKKIASAASPKTGEVLDKSAKAVGGAMTGGLSGLLLAVGTSSGPIIKELANGRLDVSAIPKFHELYPFCTKVSRDGDSIYVVYHSETLLGNYQWKQTDYADDLKEGMTGSVSRLGAEFIKQKGKVEDEDVVPLRPDQVAKICDQIITYMRNAQSYCKLWPEYSKGYLTQYRKISSIVMSYDPDSDLEDGKKSVVGRYVRYSYRNSMNIMLGSVWKNCFGADNQFIRYMVSLSKFLLKYGNDSIVANSDKADVAEENSKVTPDDDI